MEIKEIQLTLTEIEFYALYNLFIGARDIGDEELLPVFEKLAEIKKRVDYVADREKD